MYTLVIVNAFSELQLPAFALAHDLEFAFNPVETRRLETLFLATIRNQYFAQAKTVFDPAETGLRVWLFAGKPFIDATRFGQ
jgi:hypothetical protein